MGPWKNSGTNCAHSYIVNRCLSCGKPLPGTADEPAQPNPNVLQDQLNGLQRQINNLKTAQQASVENWRARAVSAEAKLDQIAAAMGG